MRRSALWAMIFFALIHVPTAHAADPFDAAAQFSLDANPNGQWSYGWSQGIGSTLVLDTIGARDSATGIDYWARSAPDESWPGFFPLVSHNGSGSTIVFSELVWQPGELSLHPGPGGELSVVRFTAAAAGPYSIAATFAGLAPEAVATTDVHVLVNGHSVFDGTVDSLVAKPSFGTVAHLAIGSTVDFAVGYGNGNYYGDTTSLSATIAAIPEPASAVLLFVGLLAFGICGRLRNRAGTASKDLARSVRCNSLDSC
jgi:hypothetical protein